MLGSLIAACAKNMRGTGESTRGACPHARPDWSTPMTRPGLPQAGSFALLRATLRLVGVWAIWGAHACGASPHTTELADAYAHSVTMLSGQYGLYWHVQGNRLHLAMDVALAITTVHVLALALAEHVALGGGAARSHELRRRGRGGHRQDTGAQSAGGAERRAARHARARRRCGPPLRPQRG